jgi:CheY-like chemotaxis protein
MAGTVLCVDPDDEGQTATATALREATGREVTACPSLAAARDALTPAVDCVVSEFELPDGSGLDLLAAVRETAPDAGFVLFTDADLETIETGALDDGIGEYVSKGAPNARTRLADLVDHTVRFRTQTAYPLPEDEAERVEALAAYQPVLDEVEAGFDRLTSLASDLLDVPMAAIGMMDAHEQSFVACYGVDFGVFPREETICTYALLEPGITTISDLRTDPRFADNEGLESYGLRAYASAPLTTPDGHVVGTFCIYDDGAREWTDEDREHLRLLAGEAMEVLELRRQLRAARESTDATEPNDERTVTAPAGGGGSEEDAADAEEDPT